MAEEHDTGTSLAIAHLSDLHFGESHRFGGQQTPTGDFVTDGYPTLISSLSEELQNYRSESGISPLVCITGDLTDSASRAEYRQALEFCQAISNDGATSLAVIPGNHDVDWTEATREARVEPWQEFFKRLEAGDTGHDWTKSGSDARVRLDLVGSHGTALVEINSAAYVQRDTPDSMRGRIDPLTLHNLNSTLNGVDPEVLRKSVRVALVHHHPILIPQLAEPGRGYEAIEGSGDLLRILRRYGFHTVLHGHKHVPFTFTEDTVSASSLSREEYPLFVVCGGSVGSRSLPPEPDPFNAYNRVLVKWLPEAHEFRIKVETRRLVTSSDGERLLPTQWYWQTIGTDDRVYGGERSRPHHQHHGYRDFNPSTDDDAARANHYARSHGVMPAVHVRPSLFADQAHEAEVWLEHHPPPAGHPPAPSLVSVRWSAGELHPVYEIEVATEQETAPALFSFYGPMVISARLTFSDETEIDTFVYARKVRR